MMRLFFAIPIEENLQLQIDRWRQVALPPLSNPVPVGNFHLTLAFLGELPSGNVERLCELTDEALSGLTPGISDMSLHIDHYGFWPRPRIFWIGPAQWPDFLPRLATKLAHVGSLLGARKSKNNFTPHITLSRNCTDAPHPCMPPQLALTTQQIALFESVQTRHGVRYQTLEQWTLNIPAPKLFPDRPTLPAARRRHHRRSA